MPTTILDDESHQEALHRRCAEEARIDERMAMKHTPGPWKAHPIETNYGLPYTPVAASTLIAKVYSTAFGDHAQSEANARLIAAAPDLLEALEWLVAESRTASATPTYRWSNPAPPSPKQSEHRHANHNPRR